MLTIAINGFGRIGRMIVRAFYENQERYKNDIKIVCINDLVNKDTCSHLLKYDTIHGVFSSDVSSCQDGIKNNDIIKIINEPDVKNINWKDLGVDIVFECSGRFTNKNDAIKHIESGAKKVIVSAPSEGSDRTVVFGINHTSISKEDIVVSNGSCTTNCLAPIASVLHEEFGIISGFMTTVHAYTGDQRLIDSAHKDLRRARAAAMSMIPSTTGAAKAIGLVLPQLSGKLSGTSIRVPTANVSMVDLVCILDKPATKDKINLSMENASSGKMRGVLAYNDLPLVSTDFNHNNHSSIFDATETYILESNPNMVRVVSWYDNEFGFSNRMLDLASYINNTNLI